MTDWQILHAWDFLSGLQGWGAVDTTTHPPVVSSGEVRFDYDTVLGGSQYGSLVIGDGPGGSLLPADQIVFGRLEARFIVRTTTPGPSTLTVGLKSNQALPAGSGPYVKIHSSGAVSWPTTAGEETNPDPVAPGPWHEVVFIYDADNEAMEEFVIVSESGDGGQIAYGYPEDVIMPWDVSSTPNGTALYGVGQVYVGFYGLTSGSVWIDDVKIQKAATGGYDAVGVYLGGHTGDYDGTLEVYGDLAGLRLTALGSQQVFHMRCNHHYENSQGVVVTAPVDCQVSKNGVDYGQSVTYAAGEIGDVNVPCFVKRTGESVKTPAWTGILTTPRRTLIPTRLK